MHPPFNYLQKFEIGYPFPLFLKNREKIEQFIERYNLNPFYPPTTENPYFSSNEKVSLQIELGMHAGGIDLLLSAPQEHLDKLSKELLSPLPEKKSNVR